MKYKLKFTGYGTNGVVPIFKEGEFVNSESLSVEGLNVFIPFSDTRFFEPVKTRKFVVEVPEENMDRFNFYVNDGDPSWTVTEITKDKYLEALKANREVSSLVIEILSQKDNAIQAYNLFEASLNEHGRNYKLSIIKDMRYYLSEAFPQIDGLKNAKDIVESFLNL